MTKSEINILRALKAANQDGVLPAHILRKGVKLTQRGFGIITSKMQDRNLLTRVDGGNIAITFGGVRALNTAIIAEPTYRQRLRDEAGDEAAAMADAFLDANPDCAF